MIPIGYANMSFAVILILRCQAELRRSRAFEASMFSYMLDRVTSPGVTMPNLPPLAMIGRYACSMRIILPAGSRTAASRTPQN